MGPINPIDIQRSSRPCAVHTSADLPTYNELIKHLPILMIEYSLLCNQLHKDFAQETVLDEEQTISRLKSALIFNQLLEHIHHHYLCVPREVVRLRKEKKHYHILLKAIDSTHEIQQEDDLQAIDAGLSLSKNIRDYTAQGNAYRNLTNRVTRFFNLCTDMFVSRAGISRLPLFFRHHVGPTMVHVNWVFHIPRLVTNTLLIGKHLAPGHWMSEKERSMPFSLRLSTQINRRWFEMGNDLVWTGVAVFNAFALLGTTLPIAPLLSIAALSFDVLNAGIRAYIEINRLTKLHEQYTKMLGLEENEAKKRLIENHLSSINERLVFQKKCAYLSVGNVTMVLLAAAIALPFLALNPPFLLAASACTIVLWCVVFYLSRYLDAQKPAEVINPSDEISKKYNLNTLGIFAGEATSRTNKEPPAPLHANHT